MKWWGLLLLLSAWLPGGMFSPGEAVAAEPVFTNKSQFRIPYRFDAEEMRRLGAKEIRLYVSTNRGSSWNHVQTVAPAAGKFDFQASDESEFWFAVRTLDNSNRLHPPGETIEPGLKVQVDSSRPVLTLQLSESDVGGVQLVWTASDKNLDVSTLQLEYIQTGWTRWRPVGVTPQASGQTTWRVPNGALVAVRGRVSDRAGNVGLGQTQMRIGAGVKKGNRPAASDYNQPIAAEPLPSTAQNGGNDNTYEAKISARKSTVGGSGAFPKAPGIDETDENLAPGYSVGQRSPDRLISNNTNNRPEIVRPRFSPPDALPQTAETAPAISAPVIQPETTLNSAPSAPNPRSAGASPGTATPTSSAQVRMLASRRFQIEYRVDEVGPTGVSQVELFITQNNGKKWYKYGDDEDRKSPVIVEVPHDGRYGFAIRVRNGVGTSSEPPRQGEAPAMIVVVDQSAPGIAMPSPRQGEGSDRNQVHITWTVSDENLGPRPIQLSYGTSPTGPWQGIQESLENSGSYTWTFGAAVPGRIYIRLTARDAVGNTSHHVTPQPLLLDLAKPKAKIVDVEAAATRR